ncbi:hypothetical protein D9613_001987 [Agrocybe pediades]|uniref:Glutamine amidotransferase type-2 domain-containing protein n=1 Tax=Agrocybe pediades TaxID=84607 RepID=A0A8H4R7U2_9AGAR|nr:hypothetical protein D9613_001987 [Agrocybe pediades]
MCGIFVSALHSDANDSVQKVFNNLSEALRRVNCHRGPDAQSSRLLSFPNAQTTLNVDFYSSELRLRGDEPVVQPHFADDNILCWNGEIFEGLEVIVISPHENDGSKLFSALCAAETSNGVRDIFSTIEGPYAFVFYHARTQLLYYARDPLGRRSLLVHTPTSNCPYFLLSSVSAGADEAYELSELSTDYIYCLDLKAWQPSFEVGASFNRCLTTLNRSPTATGDLHVFAEPAKVNTELPPDTIPQLESLETIPEHLVKTVDDLIYHLDRSVFLRVKDIPQRCKAGKKARLAVLFSGGIDSTVITYLAHGHIPLDEPIDLLNVAFENPRKIRIQTEGNVGGVSKRALKNRAQNQDLKQTPKKTSYLVPDRVTGMTEVEELRRLCPGRTWNFVEVNVPYEECQSARPIVESLMHPGRTVMDLSLALALYFASRGIGQIRKDADSEPEPYTSEARVLLNGLGSDELLGGYGRHRTVYNTGGWEGVIKEVLKLITCPWKSRKLIVNSKSFSKKSIAYRLEI